MLEKVLDLRKLTENTFQKPSFSQNLVMSTTTSSNSAMLVLDVNQVDASKWSVINQQQKYLFDYLKYHGK